MKKMNRILSLLLCMAMLLGMLPVGALAEGTDTTPTDPVSVTEPAATEETQATETAEAAGETDPTDSTDATDASETTDESTPAEETDPSEEASPAAEEEQADEGATIVIAGSDFQNTNNSHADGANYVTKLLDAIKLAGYTTADGFLFAGDYDYGSDDSADGVDALRGAFEASFGESVQQIYVDGNHDPDSLIGSVLASSGAHDADAYGVFVINEKDYMHQNSSEAPVQAIADKLRTYLTAKASEGYKKPIFVVSHLPLHYSLRTQVGGGDGKYAKHIFDVLQTAGENGLNVIFLYGHNHSHGWDDYLGGASVYLAKGDSINIAELGSTTSYTAEALQFTYMNAGFVSYYSTANSGACANLTMTVFAIDDEKVTIKRYSANGQVNLQDQGVLNTSHHTVVGTASCCSARGTETYTADNTPVWEAEINLNASNNPTIGGGNPTDPTTPVKVTDPDTNVTVEAVGAQSVTAVLKSTDNPDTGKYGAYAAYDITVEGFVDESGTATVTIPVPDTFDSTKKVTVWDGAYSQGESLGEFNIVETEQGRHITFTTTHFSQYDLTQAADVTADTGVIYLLAGSDFQAPDGSANNHVASSENVQAILRQMQVKYQNGLTVNGLLFAGDYDLETSNDADATASGIDALLNAVNNVFDDRPITLENSVLVQGEHDTMDSRLRATGGYHFEGYGVYVINEDAFPVGGGNSTTIYALGTKLYDYLHIRMSNYPSQPVFIVSHLPLLYSTRTAQDGSGKYANYLFEMINNAGHAGLNIFFLHGGNHEYGYDNYLGGEAIYLPSGTRVPVVAAGESTTAYEMHTLQFTYMNAGYTGYYSDSNNTSDGADKLTMTLFTIANGRVSVERFSKDGAYSLDAAGRNGYYASNQPTDFVHTSSGKIKDTPEFKHVKWYNVLLHEDTDADITIKVISHHDLNELKPEDGSEQMITHLPSDDSRLTALQNELIYSEYHAFDVKLNSQINAEDRFFGTVMVSLPTEWPASHVLFYRIADDGTLTSIAHKITGMTEGDKVTTVAALRLYGGGTYAVACLQDQSKTAPVQYERADAVGSIVTGTYLIGFDASSQHTTDALMVPITVTSGGFTGMETEEIANITQYKTLGVNDYQSAYEWFIEYVTGSNESDGTRGYRISKDGKYLKINDDNTLTFVDTAAEGDIFYISATTDQPANADTYAYAIYNSDGKYLTYNIDNTMVTGASNDDTKSRFVFMEQKVFNVDTGYYVPNSTIGTLKEISGLASVSGFTWTKIHTAVTSGEAYVIVGTADNFALNGYSGNIAAKTVEISDDGETLKDAAATGIEWTFTRNGSGYRISTKAANGSTYYLIYDDGLTLTTSSNQATTWSVTLVSTDSYRISCRSGNRTRYLTYRNGTFTTTTTTTVRLFGDRQDGVTGELYALADSGGKTVFPVSTQATEDQAEAEVRSQVTVYTYTGIDPLTGRKELDDSDVEWIWVDEFKPGVPGYYTMSIRATQNDEAKTPISLGTVEVVVEEGTGLRADPQHIEMTFTDEENNNPYTVHYFAFLEGDMTYSVDVGLYTEAQLLAMIQAGITAYRTDAKLEGSVYVDLGTNKTVIGDYMLNWDWGTDDNGTKLVNPNQAGSYPLTVSYTDSEGIKTPLGTVYMNVEEKEVSSQGLSSYYGYVREDSADTEILRDSSGEEVKLVIQYTDGTVNTVPVTVSMLRNAQGDPVSTADPALFMDLDVYFGNAEVSHDSFTLQVMARVVPDYPEYPDAGAVKVNKTATGIDFQASGVARVELSASGLPIKKGADVIVMMDTSSSMRNNDVKDENDNTMSRLAALQQSLENMIATFKTPGEDGQIMDIRVAIADFNGYSNNNTTPYALGSSDYVGGSGQSANNNYGMVYTNDNVLDATAFVQAKDLASTYVLQSNRSGTNYDYAMDAIYQLGTAIRQQEIAANGKYDRDLFVIFLSDGAPFQWNYYSSTSQQEGWNDWLSGTWSAEDLENTSNLTQSQQAHAYYYDLEDWDRDGQLNEHRMANAIKGSPEGSYYVIRKSDAGLPEGTMTPVEDQDNIYKVPGLGAKIFSIAYNIMKDQDITVETQMKVIQSIATDAEGATTYTYNVNSASELDNAFQTIAGEITYAATQARFLDQMGDNYNIQIASKTYGVLVNGQTVSRTITPTIEILTYDIYTRADYDAGVCTLNQVGTRKNSAPTILEVVMFNEAGTEAYSSLIDGDGDGKFGVISDGNGGWMLNPNKNSADCILSTTDIKDSEGKVTMHGGVIYAKTFVYNTLDHSVAIDGVRIPTTITASGTTTSDTTNILPAETFYWKMDTITYSELAMRYYVYLSGASEGTRPAGSYPTNNFAVLYYDNYLGNHALMVTTSPSMAWKSANVSYGFYLVNSAGVPLVNQSTGLLGSFANKIALTSPVVYQEILLNNSDEITAMDVVASADDVLPKYYSLYDDQAAYHVDVNSNASGGWTITKGNGKANSTYVTQFSASDPTMYSNALTENSSLNDYTHTVVWFAVVWNMQAYPDTVVIDYGSPVAISVLNNDMFGELGLLTGVGPYDASLEDAVRDVTHASFAQEKKFAYGSAKVDAGKVIYTPDKMAMGNTEVFGYEVRYRDDGRDDGAGSTKYFYSKVTVIPATSIYYEDSFLNFATYSDGAQTESNWSQVGKDAGLYQDEDRPGRYSLENVDANNVYGFDSSYSGFTTYSMGSAMKTTVKKGTYSTASFTFSGTGFDVISMTSSDTGAIMVTVKDTAGNVVVRRIVDTYYGYTSDVYAVTYEYQVEEGSTEAKWVMIGQVPYTSDSTITAKPENPNVGDSYTAREEIWSVNPNSDASVYQVPVMKVSDLPYGTYDVEIRAAYDVIFDHSQATAGEGTYDFYLDAIRVYNPAADGTGNGDIIDAYLKDNEGWPKYEELRNKILSADSFNNNMAGSQYGVVYIDGKSSGATVSDYTSYGPNNEVYLANGQAIAFKLTIDDVNSIADVQIGVKSADGKPIVASVFNVDAAQKAFNEASRTISTSAEMYYSAKNQCTYRDEKDPSANSAVVVLQNTGEGIMSITNIKITYKTDPNVQPAMAMFSMSAEEAGWAVMALSLAYEEPEDTLPEETQPEETQPVETQPVVTEPEQTQPAATEAEETLPAELEIPLFDAEQEKTEEFAAPAVTFAPSIALKANFSSVRINSNVKFTVTTSADVAYVTFNGMPITEYSENGDGTRSWIIKVSALNLGDMSVEVVAYNESGVASVPQVGSILVTEHYTSLRNLISDIIEWFAKML